jgi:BioD-like phosphotransacetylase family protein
MTTPADHRKLLLTCPTSPTGPTAQAHEREKGEKGVKSEKSVKRIYLAATARNDGKTTVSVGAIGHLRGRGVPVGFIKPVGQRYTVVDGAQVDEDSVLVARVWGPNGSLPDMSPVAVDRGFTRRYIDSGDNRALCERIEGAFARVAQGAELVIIEGTGHAGVGSVFGLSNAAVARLLHSKAVLITSGGIGRPIDEILLSKALFDAVGVPLVGVIVNKVLPDKYDEVSQYVRKSLLSHGIRTLGFLPHEPVLASATVRQVWDLIGGEVLNGAETMDVSVERTLVGAMSPHRLLDYLNRPHTLLITPGDREDVILTALLASKVGAAPAQLSAIVLTGGVRPHETVLRVIRGTTIPVILMPDDTYRVTSDIHDSIVKIHASDTQKIALARTLVERHLDLDALLAEATAVA